MKKYLIFLKTHKKQTILSVVILLISLFSTIFILTKLAPQITNSISLKRKISATSLALNTDKSIYLLGEKINLSIASLDKEGQTICDSNLSLEVTDPQNIISSVGISSSSSCDKNSVTNDPDYLAIVPLEKIGKYHLKLLNLDTNTTTETDVDVVESMALDIQRFGATRISPSPSNRYPMIITIRANQAYRGQIKEQIPKDFIIVWQGSAKIEGENLVWNTDLKVGEEEIFSYEYTVPKITERSYLLGPININNQSVGSSWQVLPANSLK